MPGQCSRSFSGPACRASRRSTIDVMITSSAYPISGTKSGIRSIGDARYASSTHTDQRVVRGSARSFESRRTRRIVSGSRRSRSGSDARSGRDREQENNEHDPRDRQTRESQPDARQHAKSVTRRAADAEISPLTPRHTS